MERARAGVAAAIAAALVLVGGAAAAPGRGGSARPSGQRLVVGYTAASDRAAALQGTGAVVVRRLPVLRAAEVRTLEPAAALRRAPGIRFVRRRSTLPGSLAGLYGYASGTSFAAPQVSGAAALVWAANPALTAQQVAQILKQTASGGGRWTPNLGFGVIDVAAAVAKAQAGQTGVLLSGNRVKSKLHLRWSGDTTRYTLTLTTDSGLTRVVLAATRDTSAWVRLRPGHAYAFTVSALDADGGTAATSTPLTVELPAKQTRRR